MDLIPIVQDLLEWKMGFGCNDQLNKINMSKNPFLLPPEFYKNLFAASAILQKPNQSQNDCNKLFNAQNFPRNLLFSCGDDKEVNSFHERIKCFHFTLKQTIFFFIHVHVLLKLMLQFSFLRNYRQDSHGRQTNLVEVITPTASIQRRKQATLFLLHLLLHYRRKTKSRN